MSINDSIIKLSQLRKLLTIYDDSITLTRLGQFLQFEDEKLLVKWLLEFKFEGYILEEGVFQINSSKELLESINSYLSMKNLSLIQIASIFLLFHYLLAFLWVGIAWGAVLFPFTHDPLVQFAEANFILQMFLALDLIGYLMLGIVFINYSYHANTNKAVYQTAGGAFIAWFILRLLWQYILSGGQTIYTHFPIEDFTRVLNASTLSIFLFVLHGIALFIASIAIWYLIRGVSGFIFFEFAIINLFVNVLLFTAILSGNQNVTGELSFIIIIVPIFGILTFTLFLLKSSKLIYLNFLV